MSKRSVPNRQTRPTDCAGSRRMAFMPWVSDTRRPKPTRNSVENTPVTTLRVQWRRSSAPAPRFDATIRSGPPGSDILREAS